MDDTNGDDRATSNDADGTDSNGDDATGIYARESRYLDRYVQLGIASERVISVSFPGKPEDNAEPDHPLFDRIFSYFEGRHDDFADIDIALTVPTEHRAVLEVTRDIRYGHQQKVEQIVRAAGFDVDNEDDHDTVRAALAENPTPLLIPDHRVRDGPSAAPPKIEQRLRSLEGL